MTFLIRSLSSFLAICFFGVACSQALLDDKAVTGDIKTQARTAFDAYVLAINEGDLETAAAFYDDDPDFHWVDRGILQYDSATAAGDSLKASSPPGSTTAFSYDQLYMADLADNAALLTVRYNYDVSFEGGGEGYGWQGWMTLAMVKRDNGWKIVAGQAGPAAVE